MRGAGGLIPEANFKMMQGESAIRSGGGVHAARRQCRGRAAAAQTAREVSFEIGASWRRKPGRAAKPGGGGGVVLRSQP